MEKAESEVEDALSNVSLPDGLWIRISEELVLTPSNSCLKRLIKR